MEDNVISWLNLTGLAFIPFWVFLLLLNEKTVKLDEDMVDFIKSASSLAE